MRFVTIYLIGYFALLGGAALALWQSGILGELPTTWVAIAAMVAVGLGVLLAVASLPDRVTTTRE